MVTLREKLCYCFTRNKTPFGVQILDLTDTDLDGQNDYNDPVPLDYDMDGDGYVNDDRIVNPSFSWCYVQRLVVPVANDKNLQRSSDGTPIDDNDADSDGILDGQENDIDADGMGDTYEYNYGIRIGGWQNPLIYNARYAVLIGGSDCACENDLLEMYDKLKGYNYLDENIFCLLWNKPAGYANDRVDGSATEKNMTDAFSQIGSKITKNDFFYFSEISHGGVPHGTNHGFFNMLGGPCYFGPYYPFNLSGLLDMTITSYARSLFVMSSCGCGYALDPLWETDRIVITASSVCDYDQVASGEKSSDVFHSLDDDTHWAFLWRGYWRLTWGDVVLNDESYWGFIPSLGSIESPQPIKYAFDKGVEAAQYNYRELFGGTIMDDGRSTPAVLYSSPANPTYTYL